MLNQRVYICEHQRETDIKYNCRYKMIKDKEEEIKSKEVIEDEQYICRCCNCRCKNKWKRFKIGDRVIAKMNVWCAGTVSQVDYREDHWEQERVSAYQILLDSECRFEQHYIHAPEDIDEYVRPLPKSTKTYEKYDTRKHIKCCGGGVNCPHFHVCDDNIKCRKYHFCGRRGKVKTAMWRKIAERDAVTKKNKYNNSQNSNNRCCQDGNCNDTREKSIDAILDFIGAHIHKKLKRSKKKKKKRKKKSNKIESSNNDKKIKCDCADCKAIAAQGHKAIVAMLRKGMDFSPLFKEDGPFDEIGNIGMEELALFRNISRIA